MIYTLCGVPSVTMCCFVSFQNFGLPIRLHSSCSISPTAGGTCQICLTKHRDRGDKTQCMYILFTYLVRVEEFGGFRGDVFANPVDDGLFFLG